MIQSRASRLTAKCIVVGLLLAALVACGGTPPPAPSAAPTAAPSSVPTAAVVEQPALPLLNDAIDTVTQVATAPDWLPLDSVPSPDGEVVYFTANGPSGPAVYAVASHGGTITTLASGSPLAAPWGLTISTDGQTLYVADLGAENSPSGNVVYALPASGGTPTPLAATRGSRPNVPEIVSEQGADMLFYSGFDPADEQPAIFKLNPVQDGSSPSVVFKGAPLVWPSGVAITKEGIIYVVDLAATDSDLGAVYRIQHGKAEKLADQIRTSGSLAGAALTLDESLLLVSNLNAEHGTAQVLVVNLATGDLGLINKGIAANTGAGGVHRAHRVNQFSWADITPTLPIRPRLPLASAPSSGGGGVYVLTAP
jgi:hypothetical protein